MTQKCVHKGCGKTFTDADEACVYHPGPPEFHEGQKGWKCCKPRVLTFDEFLEIPPCTTGKHSTVDDTPAPEKKPPPPADAPSKRDDPLPAPIAVPRLPIQQTTSSNRPSATASPAPLQPESEDDDDTLQVPNGKTCRRKGCGQSFDASKGRQDDEGCVHHPGFAVFHEGSKGWSCCKKRVLEFDEFLRLEGCERKKRHLFVGSGKKGKEGVNGGATGAGAEAEEVLAKGSVRTDFYQTPTTVIASLFLKKIDKEGSRVEFTSASEVVFDLRTGDGKRYEDAMVLFGDIVPEKSSFKVMGTKLELTLAKADGMGWPVLRANDPHTGEIIQSGRAGRV
jgi:hypothetical protein